MDIWPDDSQYVFFIHKMNVIESIGVISKEIDHQKYIVTRHARREIE